VKVLITGGAGFLGSNLVRMLVRQGESVLNLDKLTYAGNLASLADVAGAANYEFRRIDLCDAAAVDRALTEFCPEAVIHLAAETHVDRSIDVPRAFLESNVGATFHLVEACLRHWRNLSTDARARFRFLHASTDEVYGALGSDGTFVETTPYAPHSPYAATKAASDHLVRAWGHTFGLPVIVTNSSNNYGPFQYPEKLIPATIVHALAGEPIPIYGRGENVRDWIFVEDHCRALWAAATRGTVGATYNVGASCERRNIDLVRTLCDLLNELRPRDDGHSYAEQIEFVADRPGHDFRYAIDASKIRRELAWHADVDFAAGLRQTVLWYLDNQDWWKPLAGAERSMVPGAHGEATWTLCNQFEEPGRILPQAGKGDRG
jgi:dTDP-glucose 4,6-dehydratase